MNAAMPSVIDTNTFPIPLRTADISCGALQTNSTTITTTNQKKGRPEILIRRSARADPPPDSMTAVRIVWGSWHIAFTDLDQLSRADHFVNRGRDRLRERG